MEKSPIIGSALISMAGTSRCDVSAPKPGGTIALAVPARTAWRAIPTQFRHRDILLTVIVTALLGSGVAIEAAAAQVSVEHTFARNGLAGQEAQGTLLRGTDGALYGTTVRGGKHSQGVLFKFAPETTNYLVLHEFSMEKTNGRAPYGPLAEGKDGLLYGTTSLGGAAGLGTVFRMQKDGKGFTVLHSFTGVGADGRVPFAGVRQAKDSAWLGTTDEGGLNGCGTIYRLNGDGTDYRVIHTFGGKFRQDGEKPHSALREASDGKWYGTTAAGGRDNWGTVFVLNGDGSGYRSLRPFAGVPNDVAQPFGSLLEATDGMLYGTSVVGGRGMQGTVFRLKKDGTGFEIVRALSGLGGEGRNPHAELVQGKDGTLYGVTLNGGAHNGGVVFQLASDGSGYKTLHAFSENGREGFRPYAGLTLGADGSLYGVTSSGGPERAGAIYRVRIGN
jgi:uncharacterized repeat protein (TIGR03803 family)